MKGSEKGSPSKSNAKRNLPSSGLVENDENDLIVDKLIPQFENHKITHGKNSMSGATRKKILAEISESRSNSVDSKSVSENAVLSVAKDDSSLKVYDPVMNYLSPRPQYLRFNPNRRREIFKRLEKELESSIDSEEGSAEEIEDSSISPPKGFAVNRRNGGIGDNVSDGYEAEEEEIDEVTGYSSLSPPLGSAVNRRNGGQCEEDNGDVDDGYEVEEDEEEEIEERGWCLGGVLKLVLTLIGCFLSTSYICSMNSPMDSTTQQAIWDFKDSGFRGFLIKNETLGFVGTKLQDRGFFDRDNGTEEVGVDDESYEEFAESLEAEILEYLEPDEKEMVGDENEDIEGVRDEDAEFDESMEAEIVEYLELDEKETDGNVNEESEDVEAAELEYIEDVLRHMMIEAETDENSESDILLDTDSDNVKNDAASETEIIGHGAVDSEAQSSGESIGSKNTNEELGDSMDEVDEIEDDAEVEMEKSEWKTSSVVVVSAVLIVSASLAIVYQLKKSRSTSSEESEPVLKQKLAVEENVLPSIDRRVEFLARAPLPSQSMREASRELAPQIYTPVVELIGEIIVGRRSLRNSGKFQMTISEEESNATESEKRGSLPRPVPTPPTKPSATEISSTSFGSFTTERKISKKEGGKIQEAMIETTPVRRSSRLRNRPAVVSP